jgi:hypothetical protein
MQARGRYITAVGYYIPGLQPDKRSNHAFIIHTCQLVFRITFLRNTCCGRICCFSFITIALHAYFQVFGHSYLIADLDGFECVAILVGHDAIR